MGSRFKPWELSMSQSRSYDCFVVGTHDVVRRDDGKWYYRGINWCQNPEGKKWIGPYNSPQAVALALSHSLLSKLQGDIEGQNFQRV